MNEDKCPYCHETADECESVKLLFIDEKFKMQEEHEDE